MQTRRTVATAAIVTALMLLTQGCSGDDAKPGDKEPQSASAKSDVIADQVTKLVEAGIAQAHQGDLEAAKVTFNNALTLDPGNKFALFNLGLVAQTEKRTKAAIAFYDEALATDPEYTPALFNKAILLEPTDLEEAVAIYEEILTIDPQASTTYLRLSFAYRELGDVEKADKMRAEAIELDPGLAEVTELPKG